LISAVVTRNPWGWVLALVGAGGLVAWVMLGDPAVALTAASLPQPARWYPVWMVAVLVVGGFVLLGARRVAPSTAAPVADPPQQPPIAPR
jgi:hypothetical protein